MLDPIDTIIDGVIAAEGGFTKDPDDGGNWTGGKVSSGTLEGTNYGITVAVARANGYTGPMASLPRATAAAIYRKKYVVDPGFDKVAAISQTIAAEMVDTGVNMGPSIPIQFLQDWLNGFNTSGAWAELQVDGNLGPATLNALTVYMRLRSSEGEAVMVRALNGSQACRYLDITKRTPSQRKFLYGWIRARVS